MHGSGVGRWRLRATPHPLAAEAQPDASDAGNNRSAVLYSTLHYTVELVNLVHQRGVYVCWVMSLLTSAQQLHTDHTTVAVTFCTSYFPCIAIDNELEWMGTM